MFTQKRSLALTVLVALIAIAAWIISMQEGIPDWLMQFSQASAIVFLSLYCALFTENIIDNILPKLNQSIRDNREARVYHLIALANSMQGLSTLQTEVLAKQDFAGAIVYALDDEFVAYIETGRGKVRWEAAIEFFKASQETEPYLMPERDALRSTFEFLNKETATWLTDMLVIKGLATRGGGNRSAKLTVPLIVAAGKFNIELKELEAVK